MDPAAGATIFAVLLYLLSSHSPQPSQPGQDVLRPQAPPAAVETTDQTAPHSIEDQLGGGSPRANGQELSSAGSRAAARDRVNLRKGPGTSYSRITTLKKDAQVNILASHGEWRQVKLKDGRVGWVLASLLSGPGNQPGSPSGASRPSSPDAAANRRNGPVEVMAYFAQNYPGDPAPRRALDHSKQVLDGVVMFSYFMDAQANMAGDGPQDVSRQLKASGIDTYALIHNYHGSGFDQGIVHTVLRSESLRAKAIRQILGILDQGGFKGVNIDFENVHPGDRGYLTRFMQELSSQARARGKVVTISVPAKSKDIPGAAWFGAFDYYALGKVADKVMIMAYDEHSTVSGPGPIASIDWVREVISYAETQMPRSKIYLGIPAYGYDWPLYWGDDVKAVSYRQAVSTASRNGVKPAWDARSASCYFRYDNSRGPREVWFENGTSLAQKARLVKERGLGGIAIWRLGYEEPEFWEIIRRELNG